MWYNKAMAKNNKIFKWGIISLQLNKLLLAIISCLFRSSAVYKCEKNCAPEKKAQTIYFFREEVCFVDRHLWHTIKWAGRRGREIKIMIIKWNTIWLIVSNLFSCKNFFVPCARSSKHERAICSDCNLKLFYRIASVIFFFCISCWVINRKEAEYMTSYERNYKKKFVNATKKTISAD